MSKINLRDYYSFYTSDCYIDIPDDVLAELLSSDRLENNYLRRMYYNKAHYSLDCGDGMENNTLFCSPSSEDIYQNKLELEQLYKALHSLPEKQRNRIYAHYILGISKSDIAKSEVVSEKNIRQSLAAHPLVGMEDERFVELLRWNKVVWAARVTSYNTLEFVTWKDYQEENNYAHGHYFDSSYRASKKDFAIRAGLSNSDHLEDL